MNNAYTANKYLGKTREEAALEHAPLVRYIANRLAARLPNKMNREDLFQSGMIGLLDALDKYQTGRDAQFRTYAEFRIRGAMLDDLRASDWAPRSVRDLANQLSRAENAVSARLGRPAQEEEIAQELNVDLEEYQKRLMKARSATLLSIEEIHPANHTDEAGDALEILEDPDSQTPQQVIESVEMKDHVVDAIQHLPKKEQLILSLYYEQGLNLREIGLVLELTESRVCQLRSQAIVRLRGKLNAHLGTEAVEQFMQALA